MCGVDTDTSVPGDAPDAQFPPRLRLQRFLARAGVASRRGSENLMTAGRVTVNGVVTTELGTTVDPFSDTVAVDGAIVEAMTRPVYLILHKPTGYVTTMSDPQGRPTVAELVPASRYPGLFPVGRLDRDTTGLLLFTTDGELSHRVLHPRRKVPKRYVATLRGVPSEETLESLRVGIVLDDGPTAPAVVGALQSRAGRTAVSITITEGRKRQVRRMFSAVGHEVLELHRESFGPIVLGELPLGSWRELSDVEVEALRAAVEEG